MFWNERKKKEFLWSILHIMWKPAHFYWQEYSSWIILHFLFVSQVLCRFWTLGTFFMEPNTDVWFFLEPVWCLTFTSYNAVLNIYLLDTLETYSHPHLANIEINFVLDKTTTCLSILGNTDITRIRYEQKCWRRRDALLCVRAHVCVCVTQNGS